MKKLISIFFAIIYFATTSGMALEVHHCMGKIADFGLVHSGSKVCDKCGMKKGANACCKDEVKFVKLQDSHKLLLSEYKFPLWESLSPVEDRYKLKDQSLVIITNASNHSPPKVNTSLHLLYCVFRI